jgi:hypothetical protein
LKLFKIENQIKTIFFLLYESIFEVSSSLDLEKFRNSANYFLKIEKNLQIKNQNATKIVKTCFDLSIDNATKKI